MLSQEALVSSDEDEREGHGKADKCSDGRAGFFLRLIGHANFQPLAFWKGSGL